MIQKKITFERNLLLHLLAKPKILVRNVSSFVRTNCTDARINRVISIVILQVFGFSCALLRINDSFACLLPLMDKEPYDKNTGAKSILRNNCRGISSS